MSYDVMPNPNAQAHTETEYMGHTVHFSYFHERITLAWVDKIQAADDLKDMWMFTNALEYVLADWDVTYGGGEAKDGGPFPPDSENLHYVPLGLIINIMEAMQAHLQIIRKGGPKVPALQGFLKWIGDRWEESAGEIGSKMRDS